MKGMHRAAAVLLAFSTTLVMPAMAADGGFQDGSLSISFNRG